MPEVLVRWDPDLFVGINLLILAAIYLALVHRTNDWAFRRTAAFLAGLALLGFAYLGPPGALAHEWFWAHMTQHLIVMMIAAPLIVLGEPVLLAWRASGPTVRLSIERVMHSRVMTVLAKPAVGWAAFAVVLLVGHAPVVFNATLVSHDVMAFIERPLVLAVSLVFYYPVMSGALLAQRPSPFVRLASMGLMMIPETLLGFVIFFSPVVLYAPYALIERPNGWSALDDQKLAGALMWALAMVIDTGWVMHAAAVWFRSEEEDTAELEAAESVR